jgi:hypothetical protein
MKPTKLPAWLAAEIRPVLAFTGAGYALWAGTCILVRRGWAQLGEHLSVWEQVGAVAFTGYVAVYGCAHAPGVARFAVPGAVVAWCVAAWWVAPPAAAPEPVPADKPAASSTEADPERAREAWHGFVVQAIGDRQGVHLRDLLDALQQTGHHPDWEVADVKRVCEAAGIPVRARVRVRGLGVTVGVHRDDLPAPSQPLPEGEPQDPSDPELHAV